MLGLLGVAADHEFLFLDAFGLEPSIVSARPVRRIGALGDNAFQRKIAGVLQHLIAGLNKMLAVGK